MLEGSDLIRPTGTFPSQGKALAHALAVSPADTLLSMKNQVE